jgi:isoleucyl-tRNA synthetase
MGPKYGKQMRGIQSALAEADMDMLGAKAAAGENIELTVGGETVSLEPAELLIETVTPENLSCVEEAGTVVAIDTALTEELVREGMVRDLVRSIQNLRKESGFKVDDHITIDYRANGQIAEAILTHEDYIRQETLADSLTPTTDGDSYEVVKIGGEEVKLKLEVTSNE